MTLNELLRLAEIVNAAQRGATVKRLIPGEDLGRDNVIITAEARRVCQANGATAFDQDVTTLVLEATDYFATYRWPLSELVKERESGHFAIVAD